MGLFEDIEELIKKLQNEKRIDLSVPRYDQNTFEGRYKHFFEITNPKNLIYSDVELLYSKQIVTRYMNGENLPSISEDELWKHKAIHDATFHPVTGEKMFILGRMCAQVPMNMSIMGAMLCFYKKRSEVIFWQWINQSYNAIVNQTNSSDPAGVSTADFLGSYCTAVGLALAASLFLNGWAAKSGGALSARLVPFGATAVANGINIPLVRQKELKEGIPLWNEGKPVANSRKMAIIGISAVVLSRVAMAVPHMVLIPFMMNKLEHTPAFKKTPKLAIPLQFIMCGTLLFFSTPMGCALFPQKTYVAVDSLEADVQETLSKLPNPPKEVYYNKGL